MYSQLRTREARKRVLKHVAAADCYAFRGRCEIGARTERRRLWNSLDAHVRVVDFDFVLLAGFDFDFDRD